MESWEWEVKSDERKVENEAPTVGSEGVETDERRMENGGWGWRVSRV